MNEYMKLAIKEAHEGIKRQEGGPFGAVIVDKNNEIVASAHNQVLLNNDPTAHAEVVAIRKACEKLGTRDLSGCVLYTSCEPCPMCLAAIIWANIKEFYYACSRSDADRVGFRDDEIYEFIKGNNKMLSFRQMNRDEAWLVMEEYQKNKGQIY